MKARIIWNPLCGTPSLQPGLPPPLVHRTYNHIWSWKGHKSCHKFKKYNLAILGISESRWTGCGQNDQWKEALMMTTACKAALGPQRVHRFKTSTRHGRKTRQWWTIAKNIERKGLARRVGKSIKTDEVNYIDTLAEDLKKQLWIFNTNVQPVLLYGAVTWGTTDGTANKIQSFTDTHLILTDLLAEKHRQQSTLTTHQLKSSRGRGP